jgi:serine/threonine protein phosphatase PrpC
VSLHIRTGCATLQGRRENNEDAVAAVELPRGALLAVADGLGGHAFGEDASAMAIESLVPCMKEAKGDWKDLFRRLDEPVTNTGGATTLSAVFVNARDAVVTYAWCGDSPIVHFRPNGTTLGVLWIYRPHGVGSWVARCLGSRKADCPPEADVEQGEVAPGDVIVVASDGLDELLDGEDLLARFGSRLAASLRSPYVDFDALCERIAQAAIDAGSRDNCTVAIAVVEAR